MALKSLKTKDKHVTRCPLCFIFLKKKIHFQFLKIVFDIQKHFIEYINVRIISQQTAVGEGRE